MQRRSLIVIGALAFAGVAVASGAQAQTDETTTTVAPTSTTRAPTTTTPPITAPPATSPPTTTKAGPTTTVKGATTTTIKGGPKPPPASGASQPLDPSLLGGLGPVDLDLSTTTTLGGLFGTEDELTTTTVFESTDNAINVASSHHGPSGAMLGLAAVSFLASVGGLLIYAEDQRAKQWRHLAR